MLTPSTSYGAICPPPSVATSTAISAVAATAKPSSTSTARSAGSSRTSPLTSSHQPTLKNEPLPQWSLPWPSRRPRPIADLMPRTKPPPASTRFPSANLWPKTRPGCTRRRRRAAGRAASPSDGHSAACAATLSRPPRCCRGRRCRHHRCRRYRPTQPWRRSPSRGRHLQARSTPGIGAGGFGHGGGPTRCFWELGYHLDRAPPQELCLQAVVPMLVRKPRRPAGGVRWHVRCPI